MTDAPPARADLGVIGGSGFYEFLSDAERVAVSTPFGATVTRAPGNASSTHRRSASETTVTASTRLTARASHPPATP